MPEYIGLRDYQQDERVQVVNQSNNLKEGRVLRITPYKDNYALISVLPDDKEEIIVVRYKNKINKV